MMWESTSATAYRSHNATPAASWSAMAASWSAMSASSLQANPKRVYVYLL
jgi:hypothetical protein